MAAPPDYAELHCLSHFSFRRAASAPAELVERAGALGYRALAVTDECSMAGLVRAWEAAREHGVHLVTGTEVHTDCGLHLVLLAPDHAAYTELCRLITTARRRADKGAYRLERSDLESGLDHVLAIWIPGWPGRDSGPGTRDSRQPNASEAGMTETDIPNPAGPIQTRAEGFRIPPSPTTANWLEQCFPGRLWLGAGRLLAPGETKHFRALEALGRRLGIPRVAAGDVRMHRRGRRALLDVFTALATGRPVAECGLALAANGERHLRPREVLAELYPRAWLAETVAIAERCRFDPGGLDYRYPKELAPPPLSPIAHLRRLTLEGMARRWPDGPPETVRAQVDRELALIEEMGVEAFFLTVHDLVCFARGRGILCQGRGSAANSAVCYCLGVTEVDPSRQQLLFERFLSKERNEPPDIDVDFEHERREEVLQYVYEKYGRERAALAATVICYRPKSALKDVGRALGIDAARIERLTASLAWWDRPDDWPERLRAVGLDPDGTTARQLLALTSQLIGMPRHLSQHVGGMVISDAPLHHLVPVENAAMDGRTVIQWDKDDLEALGLLKVDCLALGMLTVLRKAMNLVNRDPGLGTRDSRQPPAPGTRMIETDTPNPADPIQTRPGGFQKPSSPESRVPSPAETESRVPSPGPTVPGTELTLETIPRDDPATYEMLQRGDAVGVFQVESRAQMAMLPRLKPACFYDLVIEVAIVRPGPIQGDMVHPYLQRRAHPERVTYPSPELKGVLERTLGVPIFQEQVMQVAIVAAGFTPGESDRLRRAMAAWKRRGGLEPFREKLISGMTERGYAPEFAQRLYSQIRGFGDYGFPESHAASFALLTWFSAWLKCRHPAAFACALLNSQPMGFYAPAQIVNDARRHGVRVLPVDVRFSNWDCTLEPGEKSFIRRARGEKQSRESPTRNFSGPFSIASSALSAPSASNRLSIRLGLRMVKGLKNASAEALVAARAAAPFRDVNDLARRAGLDRGQLRALADAGALKALAGHRHHARWQALSVPRQADLLAGADIPGERPQLPVPSARDSVCDDYASQGLSLEHHPLGLLRRQLGPRVLTAARLRDIPDGRRIQAAGLVTHRQRPGTASGVVFLSLEDETGIINVIVWPKLVARHRREVLEARLLRVAGRLQNIDGSQHLVAASLYDEGHLLDGLATRSRDFC